MKTTYEILAFDDNADGNSYLSDIEYAIGIIAALKKAYKLSIRHDHICITNIDKYMEDTPLTFAQAALYSIVVEMDRKSVV